MLILDPRNPDPSGLMRPPLLAALAGARIGWLNNGWGSMRKLGDRIDPLLHAQGASAVTVYDVPRNSAASADLLDQVARECDAAVVGLAN
jgi:hypothetical protein